MHGRLKVKTTAEQQEAKRKEREEKLSKYQAATGRLFEKRKNAEHDGEALDLTGRILAHNSDFLTMWNYRKEIFQAFHKDKSSDEMQQLYQDELSFLETCLKSNPKSYSVWEHRCWVMDCMPQPNWQRELLLCGKFLEYDERNFHCWDYRRFVVRRANIPPQEELKFSTDKISSNFSNYSSWHYRSKLLPLVHPDMEQPQGVEETALLQEHELAQNAFFTDPNDQSAWFYHRWLLGRAERDQSIRCLHVCRPLNRLVATFSKHLKASAATLNVVKDGEVITGRWHTPRGTDTFEQVLIFEFPEHSLTPDRDQHIHVTLDTEAGLVGRECVLGAGHPEVFSRDITESQELFRSELSVAKSSVLQQELESCQQLHELEPDNKWAILSVVLLMRAIDPITYQEQTLQYVDKLTSLDSYRRNYYSDLSSRFLIENTVMQSEEGTNKLDLSGKGLTCVRHLDHMTLVVQLDLSNNRLTTLDIPVYMLQCLKLLLADNNNIESIAGLTNMPLLGRVSLRNNRIAKAQALAPLASCTNVSVLDLEGNPVCSTEGFKSDIVSVLQQIKVLDGSKI
eukprot:XP_002607448.1 hypothetical protein BRAFLDRAFT_276668 [Branchiostoma floridae]